MTIETWVRIPAVPFYLFHIFLFHIQYKKVQQAHGVPLSITLWSSPGHYPAPNITSLWYTSRNIPHCIQTGAEQLFSIQTKDEWHNVSHQQEHKEDFAKDGCDLQRLARDVTICSP